MAEKTINTRILLKIDTYENWVSNNPVLKNGEVAIATLSTNKDGVQNAPTTLFKVGDGTSDYKTLKFVSGLAADVYGWAKAAEKPTYNASEIEGLSDYISGEIQDTNTQYQIVKVDDYNYKLQSKEVNGSWADVDGGTIVIPKYDDTEVKADISALEGLVGTTAVATQIANAIAALDLANTYAAKSHGHEMSEVNGLEEALEGKQAAGDYATKTEAQGYADAKDEAIAAAKKAGDDAAAALETYKTSNDSVIAAIKDGTSIDSFKDVETALAGKVDNGALDSAIADAKKAGTDAQAEVDALETVVSGKADKATTLAGYGITDGMTRTEIEQAIEDSQYDDTALTNRVKANEDAIGVLNGTGEGSVDKAITDAINEFAAKVSDDGTVNTYKELIDYAAEHGAEFTELVGEVDANTKAIATLNGNESTAGSVAKAIKDAIDAENLSQYATDTELAATNAEVAKKANDADLAAIAKTGNVNDLVQTSGDVLIFDCGDSNF